MIDILMHVPIVRLAIFFFFFFEWSLSFPVLYLILISRTEKVPIRLPNGSAQFYCDNHTSDWSSD